mmetsp:Transcript_5039/g.17473  ORF Transcript_5039/g.17473 Transcript_5039/m.17473 type:complete len:363 (-) Transcript_5039:358-1446(-)
MRYPRSLSVSSMMRLRSGARVWWLPTKRIGRDRSGSAPSPRTILPSLDCVERKTGLTTRLRTSIPDRARASCAGVGGSNFGSSDIGGGPLGEGGSRCGASSAATKSLRRIISRRSTPGSWSAACPAGSTSSFAWSDSLRRRPSSALGSKRSASPTTASTRGRTRPELTAGVTCSHPSRRMSSLCASASLGMTSLRLERASSEVSSSEYTAEALSATEPGEAAMARRRGSRKPCPTANVPSTGERTNGSARYGSSGSSVSNGATCGQGLLAYELAGLTSTSASTSSGASTATPSARRPPNDSPSKYVTRGGGGVAHPPPLVTCSSASALRCDTTSAMTPANEARLRSGTERHRSSNPSERRSN